MLTIHLLKKLGAIIEKALSFMYKELERREKKKGRGCWVKKALCQGKGNKIIWVGMRRAFNLLISYKKNFKMRMRFNTETIKIKIIQENLLKQHKKQLA